MAARACHSQESINACVVPKKPDNQPDKTIKGKYEEQPDDLNYTVRKVTPAGVVTTLAGLVGNPGSADGTGSKARFGRGYGTWARSGVAVDTAENVYVADKSNNTIRKGYPALAITSGPIQERSTDSYVRVFFWPQVR